MNEFENRLRSELRSAEHELDTETLNRLRTAREEAMSKAGRRRLPGLALPAAGMALASVAALVLVLSPGTGYEKKDFNNLESRVSENLDLYEDLEFYYWLAESDKDMRG